jgi:hypothetical protein
MEQNNEATRTCMASSSTVRKWAWTVGILTVALLGVSAYAGHEHWQRRLVEAEVTRLRTQMDLESREKTEMIERERRMALEGGLSLESIQWNLTYERASERNFIEVRVQNPFQHHRLSFGLHLDGETVRWTKDERGAEPKAVSLDLGLQNLGPGESKVVYRHFPARVETQAFSAPGKMVDLVRFCEAPVVEAPIKQESIRLRIYAQHASIAEFAVVRKGTGFRNVRDFQRALRSELGK